VNDDDTIPRGREGWEKTVEGGGVAIEVYSALQAVK